MSYTSIENIALKYLDPIIDKKIEERINSLEAINIDKSSIVKHHKYGIVIFDLINNKFIDVLPSRKKKDLIEYFCMDMWEPYKSVSKAVFPNADIVVNKFHLVTRINKHFRLYNRN